MTSNKSSQLLERLPIVNNLWETSKQGKVLNGYVSTSTYISSTSRSSTDTEGSTIELDSTYDVANNASPIVLGNNYIRFKDDGGDGDYSSNLNRYITFDAGEGNSILINPISFKFEHNITTPLNGTGIAYDRLGITAGNNVNDLVLENYNLSTSIAPVLSPLLYKSSTKLPLYASGTSTGYASWSPTFDSDAGHGDGTGGFIFGDTSITQNNKFGHSTSWVDGVTWYQINTRYARFYFHSDINTTEPGWEILVAREVFTPAPVPVYPVTTTIHYLQDMDSNVLESKNMSMIVFFGKTMTSSTDSNDPVFISNDIVLQLEVNQNGSTWWPHPTSHVILTDEYGGFVIPPIFNYGFNNLRFRLYNTSSLDCRIDLFFRYI